MANQIHAFILLAMAILGLNHDLPTTEPVIDLPIVKVEEVKETYIVEDYRIMVEVTAYAPHDNRSGMCNDGSPNSTSTGSVPMHGTIAVDPNIIPYGTQMMIPGYGMGIAQDTGGALRRKDGKIKIDVYMETYASAMAWGRQTVEVIVYKEVR